MSTPDATIPIKETIPTIPIPVTRCPVCHEIMPCADLEEARQMQRWGAFAIVAAGHPTPGEFTPVGILLFNYEGQQIGWKTEGLDRAVAAGHSTGTIEAAQTLAAIPQVYLHASDVQDALKMPIEARGPLFIERAQGTLLCHATMETVFGRFVDGSF